MASLPEKVKLRVGISRVAQAVGLGDHIPGLKGKGQEANHIQLYKAAEENERGWNALLARIVSQVIDYEGLKQLIDRVTVRGTTSEELDAWENERQQGYQILEPGRVVRGMRIDKFLGFKRGRPFYQVTSTDVVTYKGRVTNQFVAEHVLGNQTRILAIRDSLEEWEKNR